MSTPAPAIRIAHITKRYGSRVAVSDVSFDVAPGEVFALLGPNGAGKTTTIEIVEGYRPADSGTVEILGLSGTAHGREIRERIGVMLQSNGLYPAITPLEALRLFATYYGRSRDPRELLATVGLEGAASTRYRRLSGGQKQRLSLALALIGCPRVVFLDEPTAGLDPQARRMTWDIVRGLQSDGVSVLLTTHYLDEAERLADRVAIMDEGRLVALGSPSSLIEEDTSLVRLRTARSVPAETLRALPAAGPVHDEDGVYTIGTGNAPALLVEITTALRDAEVPIVEMRVGGGSLEDVFLQLTGKAFRE